MVSQNGPTIDEAIDELTRLRAEIGGNARLHFWHQEAESVMPCTDRFLVLRGYDPQELLVVVNRTPADSPRILATFVPQAWIDDNAVDVDPEGETQWDVTNHLLAMPLAEMRGLKDNTEATDALRDLPSAPAWIRNWDGPFNVRVEEQIEAYLVVDDAGRE